MKKLMIILFSLYLLLPVALSAQPPVTITSSVETDFGTYVPNPVTITPNAQSYAINPDLSNIVNIGDFQFTTKSSEMLQRNGFVVGPNSFKQIHYFYNYAQEENIPIFVTTDALLHVYHILFDYTLRILEVQLFFNDVNDLTDALIDVTLQYYNATSDSLLKEVLKRNLAFLSVGKKSFEPDYTPYPIVSSPVEEELALMDAHAGFSSSPIFGYFEDYSQYVPRGHYTRNETLKRYFKGMMWFGRIGFRLRPDEEDPLNVIGKRETAQALLLTKAILEASAGDTQVEVLWNRVYQPTVFFVGKTDDLNIYDFQTAAITAWGKNIKETTLEEIADTARVASFIVEAEKLHNPLISSSLVDDWEDFQSVTKGFRLMGQRFIPDSYILQNLVHDAVPGRMMPMGLDVMAVLGSERAKDILRSVYNQMTIYPTYESALETLYSEFGGLQSAVWSQNLYWNWLYTLMPLLFPKGEDYPIFMQSVAWTDKDLYTALASWAELRHDTILYAKQSYTDRTSIPGDPSFQKGYVEPNPYLFGRLASLARLMITGLSDKNLLLPDFQSRLENLESTCLILKSIAEKELTNQPISESEKEIVWTIGPRLEELVTFPPEIASQIENDTDEEMAVIADVHTDPNTSMVLEEGVGYPLTISVIVPIDGNLVLTQGAIFSYFEFTHPMSDRLTDEQWQSMLKSDIPKNPPIWTETFVDNTEDYSNQGYRSAEPQVITDLNDYNDSPEIPKVFHLAQNYPNPFNPETVITYQLPKLSYITLKIYNQLGQEVVTLVDEDQSPGYYMIKWDGRNSAGQVVSGGIYFYQLSAGDFIQTKKLVFLK